jgi:apolipoprotein N-acyltransferase
MGAILSGLLLIFTFPKYDLGWLAWVALVPFFLSIPGKGLISASLLSYGAGIVYFMGVFAWVTTVKTVTPIHYLVMGFYLGSYILLFGFFFNFLLKNTRLPVTAVAPFLWVALEYLRSNAGFLQFPPALLGYTQYRNLPLSQLASLTGVYGLSFLVVMVNAALTDGILSWRKRRPFSNAREVFPPGYKPLYGFSITAGLIILVWLSGWLTLQGNAPGKSFPVAVVQGNIPLDLRHKMEYREMIMSRYEDLSLKAARDRPKLIVWPEASTPGHVLLKPYLFQRLGEIVRRADAFFLVGSAEYPKFSLSGVREPRSGNTALFLSPLGKLLGQYLKIYLIPFGEYIPHEKTIPWPKFIVESMNNSNVPGTKVILFKVEGTAFGTLICSEVLYPELSREMVRKGADLLVNISNEAWFGKSSFPYQFVANGVFRAIENRVNLIKAANTGISCFIDPYGRVTDVLRQNGQELFVQGTLFKKLTVFPAGSFYTRNGDILPFSCIGISLLIFIRALFPKQRV